MSNIFKLIQLDKALLKPYYKYFLVIIIAPIVSTFSFRNIISCIVFAMTIMAMTSNYTFSVAEKNDLNRLYGLLPVSKKEIVTGRYLFTVLLGLVAILISVIFNSIVLTMIKVPFQTDEVIIGIGVGILLYSLFTAIQLPGFFKFGALKGKLFSFIPLIGLFLMGFIAKSLNLLSGSKASSLSIINNPFGILMIAILLATALYGISIGISQRIYERMEL